MKKGFKECPFCANEIKEKAIKCQYCGEFLTKEKTKKVAKKEHPSNDEKLTLNDEKKSDSKPIKNVSSQTIESSKLSAIKAGNSVKVGCIIMFVRIGIGVLGGALDWDFIYNDGFGVIDTLVSFTPVILLMIWSGKAYKYLLNKNTKDLHFDSTGWPIWGWICPIVSLFMPYQAVKDIHNISGKKNGIVGWRWGCYLLGIFSIELVNRGLDDEEGYVALIGIGLLIAAYIITINIINHVNESLQEG